ncbi:uncharacterized protein EDB91DRAFT_1057610, partial [Suillus paluster]|uniref:uncharacterized protein n=1 Tax=Suillus paluster TaxID=48578 RepID=UPI001B877E08
MKLLTAQDVIDTVGSEFSLNAKQWVAFRIIAEFFVAKYVEKRLPEEEQLRMLMTGPGGTGKTHVVKAVQCVMEHYGCAHLIRFLAPTGSAAALINGMTVHKGLGIKIKSKNRGKGNHDIGATWKYVEFILLDEVSLVGLQLLAEIDHAL